MTLCMRCRPANGARLTVNTGRSCEGWLDKRFPSMVSWSLTGQSTYDAPSSDSFWPRERLEQRFPCQTACAVARP